MLVVCFSIVARLVSERVSSKYLFCSQYVLPAFARISNTFSHKEARTKDNVQIISDRSAWTGSDQAGRAHGLISCAGEDGAITGSHRQIS